ncbi:MAG: hypothetical protein WC797_00455 [Candidatus Paceibacterota bacterium]|jgi:hypothetical protein
MGKTKKKGRVTVDDVHPVLGPLPAGSTDDFFIPTLILGMGEAELSSFDVEPETPESRRKSAQRKSASTRRPVRRSPKKWKCVTVDLFEVSHIPDLTEEMLCKFVHRLPSDVADNVETYLRRLSSFADEQRGVARNLTKKLVEANKELADRAKQLERAKKIEDIMIEYASKEMVDDWHSRLTPRAREYVQSSRAKDTEVRRKKLAKLGFEDWPAISQNRGPTSGRKAK